MAELEQSGLPHAKADCALCPACDWVMLLGRPGPQESAHCPRCGHCVAMGPQAGSFRDAIAWALAALIMLTLVFGFDFISFGTRGVAHTMSFVDAARALETNGYPALAILFILTTVVFPGLFLLGAIHISVAALSSRRLPLAITTARRVRHLQLWMMSDVLLVGILVALIKMVTLARIGLGASFVVFCLFSLLLLKTMNALRWPGLWDRIAGPGDYAALRCGQTGRDQQAARCNTCAATFNTRDSHRCPRCGQHHWLSHVSRLQLTAALLVTAAMFYVPANVFPIMITRTLVGSVEQTIIGGVLHLIQHGSWPIAVVIFVASIVVPLTKIAALGWLCLCGGYGIHGDSAAQTRLYRIMEKIGRWSMIDVFVVAVLAALVQAGALMSITPGPAAVYFAAVVIITMLAAETFDTRQLWRRTNAKNP